MTQLAILALLAAAEAKHSIPPGLLTAICTVESNLNPNAIRRRDGRDGQDSIGICQVKRSTAEFVKVLLTDDASLRDAVINIDAAGAYLLWQSGRYGGDWQRAIVAYNRGSSSGKGRTNKYYHRVIKQWKSKPQYAETTKGPL